MADGLASFMTTRYPGFEVSFQLAGFNGPEPFVFSIQHQSVRANVGAEWEVVRENVDPSGKPTNYLLGMCRATTIQYFLEHRPDFNAMSEAGAVTLLTDLYRFEIGAARKDPTPDVGPPIDVLVLTSNRQYFPRVKNPPDVILS